MKSAVLFQNRRVSDISVAKIQYFC